MSPDMVEKVTVSDVAEMNFEETELTLGLPGESRSQYSGAGTKRGFSETVELKLGSSVDESCKDGESSEISDEAAKTPTSKAQVVGWPPVRSFRKNISVEKKCKYVKVAVDGAPYLRKVDLEMYNSYQQLLSSLEEMFTICKLMDPVNGSEFVPTYEDKDGDWMLVGDVPWKMFVESCNRLRLKKSSEAIGTLAPMTPTKCSSTSR
ncbi:hypothetical protein Vadar_025173 [Vaccinium darrowii]|uniref:Uncharacterized protein n=1 Tax=Vaccinium darrowii TaxID=229202 RepID=A0ACB7ZLP3_9ERIC|nr:hypothetical protein Vadar_025173 [Vaccinium darrowii]